MLQLVAFLINPVPGVDSEGQVFETRQAEEAFAESTSPAPAARQMVASGEARSTA